MVVVNCDGFSCVEVKVVVSSISLLVLASACVVVESNPGVEDVEVSDDVVTKVDPGVAVIPGQRFVAG